MDSYEFWMVFCRVVYCSSSRDFGDSNLLLTLVYKSYRMLKWYSNIMILCWPRKMLMFIFTLLIPWLNSSRCVKGRIVILGVASVSLLEPGILNCRLAFLGVLQRYREECEEQPIWPYDSCISICLIIWVLWPCYHCLDRLCGLVVRVPAYRSRGPG
jgi:hypothetical protein